MPNDNEPHIGHVILDKKYRGMGLGKEIMMVMINIALKEFIPKEIKLAVFETNKNVYELYKSIGFKSYETKYRKDYNGKNQKLILMKLEFNFLLNI
jgi:predicted GNAT family N-acyltransferase